MSDSLIIFKNLKENLSKWILGQDHLIERLLIALLADGHLLVEGAPGLAKTRAIKTLGEMIEGDFHRIQFTPDLMPSDITGTEIIEEEHGTGKRSFKFFKGPVFANIVLADEINRTPPKTQAALLEAMEAKQVTIEGITHKLPAPFVTLATQNPIEQEGTYPLPEAQMDRFLMKMSMGYPDRAEEKAILARRKLRG